jgi:hypothetical protein
MSESRVPSAISVPVCSGRQVYRRTHRGVYETGRAAAPELRSPGRTPALVASAEAQDATPGGRSPWWCRAMGKCQPAGSRWRTHS